MLLLFSLFAAAAIAQNCDVSGLSKSSQKRRECKKRSGCKWSGAKTEGGETTPGSCSGSASCGSLAQNACKKRNNCFINWTANGKPCQDYNPNVAKACSQLGGKRNMAKCNAQPKCIMGSGDRENKSCLTIPDNLEDQDCNNFSNRPNKYLCKLHSKCEWKLSNKKCNPKTDAKTCTAIGNKNECEKNEAACQWVGNSCSAIACANIDKRAECNASKNNCQWLDGFHADDFDHSKNKEKQKGEKEDEKREEGTCRNGIKNCADIVIENHCKLAESKYGKSGCHWNKEAKEIDGATRCSKTEACAAHGDSTSCLTSNNMSGGKCVWQKSGTKMRCMEFKCDDPKVATKNKCNTVGCHWHRNKDKRDPDSKGFCGVWDAAKGRRL